MNTTARLHQPQRLEGESMKAYRQRREESRQHATSVERGTLIDPRSAFATSYKRVRRADIKAIGIRQYKRMHRQLAAARAAQ